MLRRLSTLAGLALLPLLVLAVLFVLPVSAMLREGLYPDGHLDVGAVLEVLGRERVHRVVWFTVWSSTVATVLAVLLGLPSAYVLYRTRFPGRGLLRAGLLVPFVLPTVVVGVAFRELLSENGPLGVLGLDGTAWAIIAGLVFFNTSVVIRAVGATWDTLDPRPAQAAAALGASPARVFWTVTLPALRPSIVAAASVVFLFCATAFGVVLTLGGLRYATVETEIYQLTTEAFDLQAAAALSILQLVAVLVLLAVAQRLRSLPSSGAGRIAAPPRRLRAADLPAVAALGLVLVLVGAPILTLVTGSLTTDHGWSLESYRLLQTTGSEGALEVPVTEALMNSLRIAVDATWMSLLIGGLLAIAVTRRSITRTERRLRSGLDAIFMLPLGVSAVTVGFGLLIALDEPPLDLRDSPLLVPMAQALVALPLVVRTLVPVLAGIDDRQRQAAAALGAPGWRVFTTVDLPVLVKPLAAAAGFAFAVSLGEFGATSFLARAERPTVPVVIFRLLGHPGAHNYQMALAAAVILGAVTALVMLVVERLRVGSVGAF